MPKMNGLGDPARECGRRVGGRGSSWVIPQSGTWQSRGVALRAEGGGCVQNESAPRRPKSTVSRPYRWTTGITPAAYFENPRRRSSKWRMRSTIHEGT
jgi:hypothetical protein